MASELHQWQSAPEWTSTSLDRDHAQVWSAFYLAECTLVMLLNGLVIVGSVKSDKVHAELLANANSLLFFMLCVNNFLYGCFQALLRLFFISVGHTWLELPCAINAAVNTLFLAASLLYLMAIALEQLASIVLLARVPIDLVPKVIVGIYTSAALWVLAQLMPPGRAVYSAGGEFCYSTATLGWVGVVNVLLVPMNLATLVGAYVLIFVRLNRMFHESNQRRKRDGKLGGHGGVGKSLETVVAGRPALESLERRSREDREASVQRKFAIRGALALLNSCFLLIPIWIVFLNIHLTAQRGSISLDTAAFCFAFFSSILDPIIGCIQDKRIRAAIYSVVFRPAAGVPESRSSSSTTASPGNNGDGEAVLSLSLSRKQPKQLRSPLMSVLGNE